MKAFIYLFIILYTSCSGDPASSRKINAVDASPGFDSTYTWVKVLDSAPWKKSYNFQMFSIRDTLWTFHGDGNWYSTNGKEWMKSSLPNAINNLAFLDYIFFRDAMFGLGYFDGNIEQFTFKPSINRSTDLRNWTTIATESNLPNRFFYHPFVFDKKIWIIGGEDKQTAYADIWNSADAIHWERIKNGVPFGRTSSRQVVELDGTLYFLGNDVWASPDALHWEKRCDEILKGQELFGYAAIVFDKKIWLLGCNRNGKFSSQVLSSSNGKDWETHEAPWLPRGGIAATVHNNRIYMTGGKYGGTPDEPNFRYDNDVWMLMRK
jgi:hypothetical protein